MLAYETESLFLKMISEIGVEEAKRLIKKSENSKEHFIIIGSRGTNEYAITSKLESELKELDFNVISAIEHHWSKDNTIVISKVKQEALTLLSNPMKSFYLPITKGVYLEIYECKGKYHLNYMSNHQNRTIKTLIRAIPSNKKDKLVQLAQILAKELHCSYHFV